MLTSCRAGIPSPQRILPVRRKILTLKTGLGSFGTTITPIPEKSRRFLPTLKEGLCRKSLEQCLARSKHLGREVAIDVHRSCWPVSWAVLGFLFSPPLALYTQEYWCHKAALGIVVVYSSAWQLLLRDLCSWALSPAGLSSVRRCCWGLLRTSECLPSVPAPRACGDSRRQAQAVLWAPMALPQLTKSIFFSLFSE